MADSVAPGSGGGFVVVTRFASESDATEAARLLVEHGVGAFVEDAPLPSPPVITPAHSDAEEGTAATKVSWPTPPPPAGDPAGRYAVCVLANDLVRACVVLNLSVPEYAAPVEETAKVKRSDLKKLLIIWAIAMVVIPVAAFYVTYFLASR